MIFLHFPLDKVKSGLGISCRVMSFVQYSTLNEDAQFLARPVVGGEVISEPIGIDIIPLTDLSVNGGKADPCGGETRQPYLPRWSERSA
jgi:hypothetical protein